VGVRRHVCAHEMMGQTSDLDLSFTTLDLGTHTYTHTHT